jgi:uncharacterized protein involved in outer membrane biogenesis
VPISQLSTRIQLSRGRLAFAPLDLEIGGGHVRATAVLDAEGPLPRASLALGLSRARVGAIRPELSKTLDGRLAAQLLLTGAGTSPSALAADLSGRASVAVTDGHLARGPADALGGYPLKGLIAASTAPGATVRLQCAGGSALIAHGSASMNDIRIFTDVGETDSSGAVDLGKRSVSVKLTPRPRPGDLAQTPAPISISGPLIRPKISADIGAVKRRRGVGAKVKLALLPVSSLLPGRTQDFAADCARIAAMAYAKQASTALKFPAFWGRSRRGRSDQAAASTPSPGWPSKAAAMALNRRSSSIGLATQSSMPAAR